MIESAIVPNAFVSTVAPARTPMMTDGWFEFNQSAWGVTPHRARFSVDSTGGPALEAVYYLNAAGRIVFPPLTPYLPMVFEPDSSAGDTTVERQWHSVAHLLARDMRRHGLRQAAPLPPYVPDIRPWQSAGFEVNVKYTYVIDLPYDDGSMRSNVRRSISRSQRQGFVCERSDNMDHLHECLLETEERQGFSEGLTASILRMAQSLVGDDTFRVYVCYAPNGEPAGASVEIHQPGDMAIGWVAGTKTAYLTSGVSQHLVRYVLDDLYAAGATAYDFVGAGIPSVAAFKAQWAPHLVPYYVVDGGGRAFIRQVKRLVSFKRGVA